MGSITPDDYKRMLVKLEGSRLRNPAPIEEPAEDELPIHKEIIEWCDKQMLPYVHSRTDKRTRCKKGVVDFVIGYNGKTFWIEVKDDEGTRSPSQIAFAIMLERQGIPPHLCRSFTEFLHIILNT